MKKLIIALLLGSSMPAFAQNGFYLQPEAGLGFTNSQVKLNEAGMWQYGAGPSKGFSTYNGRIGIGYQYNNWQFSTGIDFLRTGYSINYYTGDFISVLNNDTHIDYSFALPLKVGYQIHCCKHFFITPSAGVDVAYNYSERFTEDALYALNNGPVRTQDKLLKGSELAKNDNLLGLWGNAQLRIGYKVNTRLNVIAGPEVQYMLTSMTNGSLPSQRNYCYSFNAGITWKLKKTQTEKAKN